MFPVASGLSGLLGWWGDEGSFRLSFGLGGDVDCGGAVLVEGSKMWKIE